MEAWVFVPLTFGFSRELWEAWCGLGMLDSSVELVISNAWIYPVKNWLCTSLLQIFTPLS